MNMIRHHDVTSDQPRRGPAPSTYNCLMNVRRCENRAPLHSTCGHENNDCTVMPLPRRKMNGMFAPRSLECPEGHASACPASRGSDVRKHVPPLRNHRAFYVVAIRFVISTASSRAAAACEPETLGSPPVSAQSTKEASCCRNGSSFSIATASRVICPLTRR